MIKTLNKLKTIKKKFQDLLDLFEGERRKKGLGWYSKRSEVTLVSQNKESPQMIMQNLEGYPRMKEEGHYVNNLKYADGSVLIAENEENLQELLDIFEGESRKKGLELYSKRSEVMVVSQNKECPRIKVFINENKLKQRDQFKYLGILNSK